MTPLQRIAAVSALAASVGAGLGVAAQRLALAPPANSTLPRCVMAVGNFEAQQFSNDSLFLIDATSSAIMPANGLATVSTTAPVPPAYVNRNVRVCFQGASTSAPGPTSGKRCVTAVQAFYANERTSGNPGSVDSLLYVPIAGPVRDSLARADSLLNGAVLPQPPDSVLARPITICVDSLTPIRAVLTT